MTIIVDTREQLPYWSDNRKALIVGDYTTKKLHNIFHIERKSLGDLYGTLTSGNRRFKYELFRAAWQRISICVYVEGSRVDFINKRFPKGNERKFSKDGLDRLITTFEKKYHLVFHWHSSRNQCKNNLLKRLVLEEKAQKAGFHYKSATK